MVTANNSLSLIEIRTPVASSLAFRVLGKNCWNIIRTIIFLCFRMAVVGIPQIAAQLAFTVFIADYLGSFGLSASDECF
jgi:hypothetical protein